MDVVFEKLTPAACAKIKADWNSQLDEDTDFPCGAILAQLAYAERNAAGNAEDNVDSYLLKSVGGAGVAVVNLVHVKHATEPYVKIIDVQFAPNLCDDYKDTGEFNSLNRHEHKANYSASVISQAWKVTLELQCERLKMYTCQSVDKNVLFGALQQSTSRIDGIDAGSHGNWVELFVSAT